MSLNMAHAVEINSEPVKNICAIVEERDKVILERDIKIKYYKGALENVTRQIKFFEKAIKDSEEEYESVERQLGQLEFIEKSIQESQGVAMESLINHQYFEKIIDKELEAREKAKQLVEQECQDVYNETKEKLSQNPLCQELEAEKVEFLKVDIKRRDLEVKIRQKKKINAMRMEIQKKIFYNFFVKMAENYLTQQKLKELERLKAEELEAVKKLYVLQEAVKLRNKLDTPRDNLKRMKNITFGFQDCNSDKNENKVELPQQKKETRLFNEKLDTMFHQDESKTVVVPSKVQILSQKVIVPAFVAPNVAPPEKRKNKIIDISRKWHKMMKSSSFSRELPRNRIRSSQESQFSQESQQSQRSQQLEHCRNETSIMDNTFEQPDENLNKEGIFINQPKENPKVSMHTKEQIPSIQYQTDEKMSIGPEQIKITENSEIKLSLPSLPEHQIPNGEMMKNKLVYTRDHVKPKIPVSKRELIPKTAVSEPSKTVRFNFDQISQQTENKSNMFSGPSMFGSGFSPFSNQTMQKETVENATDPHNSMFNMSLMDQASGNYHTGLEFESVDIESPAKSPEFSYELEKEAEQQKPFKTPEMPPFGGGGGFFSFGKNMFNPF